MLAKTATERIAAGTREANNLGQVKKAPFGQLGAACVGTRHSTCIFVNYRVSKSGNLVAEMGLDRKRRPVIWMREKCPIR
jgi:hypothetical protein